MHIGFGNGIVFMGFYMGKECLSGISSCENMRMRGTTLSLYSIYPYGIRQLSSKGFIGRIGVYIGFMDCERLWISI